MNIEEGGNYIFFCGGTGVLPFIDLFAYMLWKAVALVSPENMFFEDEEFEFNEIFITVYCFFTSWEDAVGLTILEGIEVI